MRGRRIAFDCGQVRIGVAICDADGIVVTPLDAISFKNRETAVAQLMEEYQPIAIYIGKPLHLSGAESKSLDMALAFEEELKRYGIPTRLIDERLTTKSAARSLAEAGYSTRESKGKIDSAAAVAILETGLAMEKK